MPRDPFRAIVSRFGMRPCCAGGLLQPRKETLNGRGELFPCRRNQFFPGDGSWNKFATGGGDHFRQASGAGGNHRDAGGEGLDDNGRTRVKILRMEQNMVISVELRGLLLSERCQHRHALSDEASQFLAGSAQDRQASPAAPQ